MHQCTNKRHEVRLGRAHPTPYTLHPELRAAAFSTPPKRPVCARAIQGESGRKRERARGGGWYEACTHTKSACPAAVGQRLCDACEELEHHVMQALSTPRVKDHTDIYQRVWNPCLVRMPEPRIHRPYRVSHNTHIHPAVRT